MACNNKNIKTSENSPNQIPPELDDRQYYDTPIGPVCMSKTEHEAYLEELESREGKSGKQ